VAGEYGGHGQRDRSAPIGDVALSPDGRRIALSLLTELGTDIWIKQLPSRPATRLTLHDGVDRMPAWTRDGRAVTFLSDRTVPAGTEGKGSEFRGVGAVRRWHGRAEAALGSG
jgi:Periplasmic component of the Tol biopolymer transport system